MQTRGQGYSGRIWLGVKAGCAALAGTLLLLLPMAALVNRGFLEPDNSKIPVLITTFIISFIVEAALSRSGRGEGLLLQSLISLIIMSLLLLLLIAAMPDTKWELAGLVPTMGSALAGFLLGSFIQINKKSSGKRRPRKKYNR